MGNTELISPAIAVPARVAQLAFRNLYNLESGVSNFASDGMVLEYSVNGGAFTDITSGGNAFLTGAIRARFRPVSAARSPAARRGAVCRVAPRRRRRISTR